MNSDKSYLPVKALKYLSKQPERTFKEYLEAKKLREDYENVMPKLFAEVF